MIISRFEDANRSGPFFKFIDRSAMPEQLPKKLHAHAHVVIPVTYKHVELVTTTSGRCRFDCATMVSSGSSAASPVQLDSRFRACLRGTHGVHRS